MLTLIVIVGVFSYFYNPFATSIPDAYRAQLDRLSPTYIEDKRVACADVSGTWKESRRSLGCYNIGEDWDSSWCDSTEGSTVENICNGINANWVCDQRNAGCSY